MQVVDRKLNEIRQVSYSSIEWDKLQIGMKVAINYNIAKPKQWGLWYDYVIERIQKRYLPYLLFELNYSQLKYYAMPCHQVLYV